VWCWESFFCGVDMKRKPIDVEELKKVFRIRNGVLERIDYRYTNNKWKQVKLHANHTHGYCHVGFNGKMILHHVVIWILSTGKDVPAGMEIDHINGNKIDNRIENLRLVTHRGNGQNRKEHRNGKLQGCYYRKLRKKYMGQINISGKNIKIGLFETEQEANEAYNIACKHIKSYVDNESFRELINKEMGI
jgi:hypothetical protein